MIGACESRANWGRSVMRQEFSEQRHKEEELAELSIWQWMPTTEPPPCGITSGRPRLRHSPPSFFPPSLPPLTGQQRLHSENEPGSQTESLSMWLSDTQRDGRQNSISLSSLPHISSLIYASFCALCVFKLRILQQKTKFHMNIKQKNRTKPKRSGKICYKCTVRGNWSSSACRLWRINLQVSVYWLSKLVQALIPRTLYRAENPHRHIKLVLIRWSLGVEDFLTLH